MGIHYVKPYIWEKAGCIVVMVIIYPTRFVFPPKLFKIIIYIMCMSKSEW